MNIEKLKKIKAKLNVTIKKMQYKKKKKNLLSEDFTIVNNNCWGGFIYQYFDIKYQSPFIGVLLFASDYIRLLEDFEELIYTPIRFIDRSESRYKEEADRNEPTHMYPIAIIGDDIELHFVHYNSDEEARRKWESRVKRINMDKLLIKFTDRDLCTEEHIRQFDNLDFKNKVCFTAKKYDEYKSVIHFSEFEGKECVDKEWMVHDKYMDIVEVLNSL